MDEMNKEIFIQDIKIESKDNILMLQRKIKEKQIEISDLTDQELDEMIELYKNQIEDKKARLKQYRVKIKNINAT
jgi:low affinity Fe/Cu permease